MSQFLAFKPFPGLAGPHLQTLVAGFPTFQKCPPSQTRIVPLQDGDKLACEVSTPAPWTIADPTIFTIHGLCGSHRSPYQVRLATKLYKRGVRVVRINLRGCGSGRGLARLPYHAGCSEDILEVLKTFKNECPHSHFRLVAYSMGGNVLLKLVGEMGSDAEGLIDKVVAVCPPINLHTSARLMSDPSNRIYRYMFMRWLVNEVRSREAYFPELTKADVNWKMSFQDFDDVYTAPRQGFRNAMDYYTSSSAELLIPRIKVETKIVFSTDDPIIDCNALDHLQLDEHVRVYKTSAGGHVAFFGNPTQDEGVHWLDTHIIDWTLQELRTEPLPQVAESTASLGLRQ